MNPKNVPNASAICRAVVLAASIATAFSAHAQYSNVYVFGDSLSDTGNLGRFTNGDKRVWADHIAAASGGVMQAAYRFTGTGFSLGTGNGFAIGGAQADDNLLSPAAPLRRPGATGQVKDLIARDGGKLDPKALYLVWVGGNDINAQLAKVVAGGSPFAAAPAMEVAAQAALGAVNELKTAGAKHVLVVNLPNLGATPAVAQYGPSAQGLATSLAETYNKALAAGLAGSSVAQFDIYPLFTDLIANPTKYGLANNNGKLCGSISAGNCTLPSNGFLFADDLHPTAYAHGVVAQWILGILDVANDGAGIAALAVNAPLMRDGAAMRAADSRSRNFIANGARGNQMYALADYADVAVAGANGGADTHGESLAWAVGFDTSLGQGTFVGGSIGQESVPLELVTGGRLKYQQSGFNLYLTHRYGAAYVTARGAFGTLDYRSDRQTRLGPFTASEHAEFGGRYAGVGMGAGYRMGDAGWSHGPFVGVDWRRVEVNGFSEGNSVTAAMVGSQKGDRTSGRIGYELSASSLFGNNAARPYAEIAYQHDSSDDRNLSVGTGSTGTLMPAMMPGQSGSGARLALGVNTRLSEKVDLNLGVNAASGGPQGRSTGLTILFSAGF